MSKPLGAPSVCVTEPYITIQDWHVDSVTTLTFAKLTLEQAVAFRNRLESAISIYRERYGA